MTALAASPVLRLPPAAPQKRFQWSVLFSVLLHLGLLALIILAARHQTTPQEPVPPAPVAMMFESGGKTPPSIANPTPVSPNQPGSPKPQPSLPPAPRPVPTAPPMPRVQPAPQPQPREAPRQEHPAETPPPKPAPTELPRPEKPSVTPPAPAAQPAPQREQEAAPAAQPSPQPKAPPAPPSQATPPPRPVPMENAPLTNAPAEQAPVMQAEPLPPPPPPVPAPAPQSVPRAAVARPREAARPAPARPSLAFPAPMALSLGPPPSTASAPPPSPPRVRPSAGTMDLSFTPVLGDGDITQLHPQGKGDDVGADWLNLVSQWWIQHRFYPDEAARLQQEGDVVLRLKVAQSGHVETLDLVQGSGSPWLDMGAESVFRNANLPPLPGNVHDPDISLQFTIHYEILR